MPTLTKFVYLMHKCMFNIMVCLFIIIFADVLWLVEYTYISTLTNLETTLAIHEEFRLYILLTNVISNSMICLTYIFRYYETDSPSVRLCRSE